jgi:2-oxoglutarate dehydrogenase complex dehydrogenase (E1) component-like enzyme
VSFWPKAVAAAIPVVLHGDAAMPGQGVVAESLNLHDLDGPAGPAAVKHITVGSMA